MEEQEEYRILGDVDSDRAAIEAAVREMADLEVTESEPEPESMSDLTDLSKTETERADSDMLGFEESD